MELCFNFIIRSRCRNFVARLNICGRLFNQSLNNYSIIIIFTKNFDSRETKYLRLSSIASIHQCPSMSIAPKQRSDGSTEDDIVGLVYCTRVIAKSRDRYYRGDWRVVCLSERVALYYARACTSVGLWEC